MEQPAARNCTNSGIKQNSEVTLTIISDQVRRRHKLRGGLQPAEGLPEGGARSEGEARTLEETAAGIVQGKSTERRQEEQNIRVLHDGRLRHLQRPEEYHDGKRGNHMSLIMCVKKLHPTPSIHNTDETMPQDFNWRFTNCGKR